MPNGKTALLAGASGLIGSQLLPLLLQSDRYQKVIVVGRTPLNISHQKAEQVIIDFDNLSGQAASFKADDIFCCLGTTMRKAKSKEAFRKVDYLYPLDLAKVTKAQGAHQFFLVSALGANRNSSIFYNKVKGETEDAISAIGFYAVHLLRPSLLLGPRVEKRSGEDIAKVFYGIFSFLIPKRYKGIQAIRLARAMLAYAEREERGIYFHESMDLQAFK